jgi:cation diffusion facilitator family transporter
MDQRTRYGYLEGIVAIIVNTALFALKYWAGVVSGSVALMADAWHTLSDSISSAVLIGGIRLSSRKPDKEHPFGHGRWEQITAIFIGFILGIIAWGFMTQSFEKFRAHESANFGLPAIVVTIISILVKEAMARWAFYIARKTGNNAVKADGWHHRSDALSSVVLLAGIMFRNQFWWIDSVLGVIIALMLFYTTFEIVKDAISKILGERPSKELIDEVKAIIQRTVDSDIEPHHFHIHNYGSHRELTFHILVDPQMDVHGAHCMATAIEKALVDTLNIESTIHIEPRGVKHM